MHVVDVEAIEDAAVVDAEPADNTIEQLAEDRIAASRPAIESPSLRRSRDPDCPVRGFGTLGTLVMCCPGGLDVHIATLCSRGLVQIGS
jgi:hypothetical protein